mgnify:CR=1 FL=1
MPASSFSMLMLFCLSQSTADTEAVDKQTPHSNPTSESVLEKWRAADAKWQTMDAQLVTYRYDHTFEVVIIGQGRLYFEKPANGRFTGSKRIRGWHASRALTASSLLAV